MTFKHHTFLFDQNEYADKDELKELVISICSDVDSMSIDFSLLNMTNECLLWIYDGLVMRETKIQQNELDRHMFCIKFMNILSNGITESGILLFCEKLQGSRENNMVRPTMDDTIIKIGFPLCEEFTDEINNVCPSVMASGMRFVY